MRSFKENIAASLFIPNVFVMLLLLPKSWYFFFGSRSLSGFYPVKEAPVKCNHKFNNT